MKQLDEKEVRMMFDYYLRLLPREEEMGSFYKDEGFENLLDLMRQYGRKSENG